MAVQSLYHILLVVLSLCPPSALAILDLTCRHANSSEGGCSVDGSGCEGDSVQFLPHALTVSSYNPATKALAETGSISSWALAGGEDTWQMYLHGPLVRERERVDTDSIPPIYVQGTWVQKVYRFDNFSKPESGKALKAQQKMVGHSISPSTSFPIEDANSTRIKGLMVAGGGSFLAVAPSYKGGVYFLPADRQKKCTEVFPIDPFHKMWGQSVNTVDCHKGTGICFFTVWQYFDDQSPMWNPIINKLTPDCLYYCIAEGLHSSPSCKQSAVVLDEKGDRVCHQHGVGAVHGMTIGNTDKTNPSKFDIFLVFTGKAQFDAGESSMKKLSVEVKGSGSSRELAVLKSQPFATDLFVDLPARGHDVGGDHAWVDSTGKWIWVSTFRLTASGVHLLDYDTGRLHFSITGMSDYLADNFAYSSGIHGVGTLGQKGSYLAVATSACENAAVCAPIPWSRFIPKKYWAKGVMFIIDLASMTNHTSLTATTIV